MPYSEAVAKQRLSLIFHVGLQFDPLQTWAIAPNPRHMSPLSMPHSQADKIALFIDGANLHATAKALGFEIDYRRLSEGVSGPRHSSARILLQRCGRWSGAHPDSSSDRLAGLQWVHGRHQDSQGVHRRRRAPPAQEQHERRACGRRGQSEQRINRRANEILMRAM